LRPVDASKCVLFSAGALPPRAPLRSSQCSPRFPTWILGVRNTEGGMERAREGKEMEEEGKERVERENGEGGMKIRVGSLRYLALGGGQTPLYSLTDVK